MLEYGIQVTSPYLRQDGLTEKTPDTYFMMTDRGDANTASLMDVLSAGSSVWFIIFYKLV